LARLVILLYFFGGGRLAMKINQQLSCSLVSSKIDFIIKNTER